MFNKTFMTQRNIVHPRRYLVKRIFEDKNSHHVRDCEFNAVSMKDYNKKISNLKRQQLDVSTNELSFTVNRNNLIIFPNKPVNIPKTKCYTTARLARKNFDETCFHGVEKAMELPLKTNISYVLQEYFLLRKLVSSLFHCCQFIIEPFKVKDKTIIKSTIKHVRGGHSSVALNGNYVVLPTHLMNQTRCCSTVSSDESRKKSHDLSNNTSVANKLQMSPKNVLNNIYDVVAQELGNRDFKVQPTFSIIKEKKNNHSWCCTYYIKWPEPTKFVSIGYTKREASHKAALSALLWLKKNGKITKDGHPVLVEKEEAREMMKKKVTNLMLDHDVMKELQTVCDIYQNEFVPILCKCLDRGKESEELDNLKRLDEPNDVNFNNMKQKMFKKSSYLSKEKVQLPISQHKQQFIDLLKDNRVVIIKGEPGCGKSTRVPQYVLEAWAEHGLTEGESCRVVVTQPRRIAAISLANRVSNERDEHCGHIIGYQVRLKSNFNPSTGRILYCTTGILLRHLQSDLALSSFSHIILDEAHERDVNTDLLMNLVRNSLRLNNKLKLIVMSATVDTEMFKNYFEDAVVMHIPGFTYPVRSYFLDDLPELGLSKTKEMCNNNCPNVIHEDVVKVVNYIHNTKKEGAILCFLPGWEDISRIEKMIPITDDMSVLCLHSRLKDSDQWKIFSKAPPGIRKVILSTNIAETSVTIDDVVYVIDTGIHKENRFDSHKGVTCIDNYWISQASMIQRKGRAGRVQPGESFHLYTKSKYETLPQYTDPEILKTSLTKIVLNSKVYSNNMDALEFMSHLPSPPEENATKRAVLELKDLELLDENENLTSLGKTLATFQLEPKLAKVLVNAVVYKCVTPVVDIVTLFSANTELFGNSLLDKEAVKRVKIRCSKHSDHLAMMRLFETWLDLVQNRDEEAAEKYCYDANLTFHKLVTINKLRKIHFDYLYNGLHQTLPIADDYSDNDELVKAVLLSGVGTLLKRRDWDIVKNRYKKRNVFLTNNNQKASIASESVNHKKTSFPSDLFVYFNELRSNIRRTTLIRECSVISPLAVLLFSPKELTISEDNVEHNKVILKLKDTQVDFLCTKEEAVNTKKCKEALKSAYQYFIFQMTDGGESDAKVNEIWNKILKHVNVILLKCGIK